MTREVIFQPKTTDETRKFNFNFVGMLSPGDTVASAVLTMSVYSGVDASPSSMLIGSPTVATPNVSQKVGGGVEGVVYLLNCAATTTAGEVLVQQGLVAVMGTI